MKRRKPTLRAIHYSDAHLTPPKVFVRVAQPIETPTAKRIRTMGRIQGNLAGLNLALCAFAMIICMTVLQGTGPATTAQNVKQFSFAPKHAAVRPQPKPHTSQSASTPVQATPVSPTCPKGAVLTTVAHEDDDILFMNPTLQQQIRDGMCIYTAFTTAGDDGQDSRYWTGREQGARAAYAVMANMADNWTYSVTKLDGRDIATYTAVDNPHIVLYFLHLPDGNLSGQGFPSTNYESLQKLQTGEILSIHTLDNTGEYTIAQLITLFQALMHTADPTVINTQAFAVPPVAGDHTDHQAVGYVTSMAARKLGLTKIVHRYIGYPSGNMQINLTPEQINDKERIFNAYKLDDSIICSSTDECFNDTIYNSYFSRQYQQTGPRY